MRFFADLALIQAGLAALACTYYWIFPNADGLFDVSRLEWMFLLLYSMAVLRLHSRHRQIGKGVFDTSLQLVNSAGACAVTYFVLIGIALALNAASDMAPVTKHGADDLSASTWVHAIWIGSLVVFTYLAAPAVRSPTSSQLPPDAPAAAATAQDGNEANK